MCSAIGLLVHCLAKTLHDHPHLYQYTLPPSISYPLDRFESLHPDYDMLQSPPANIERRSAVTILDLGTARHRAGRCRLRQRTA